jgi:hypothetical protein
MNKLKGIFKNYKPSLKYSRHLSEQLSKSLKRALLVRELIQDKYGLGRNSVFLNWCRKYVKFAYPKNNTIGHHMQAPFQ